MTSLTAFPVTFTPWWMTPPGAFVIELLPLPETVTPLLSVPALLIVFCVPVTLKVWLMVAPLRLVTVLTPFPAVRPLFRVPALSIVFWLPVTLKTWLMKLPAVFVMLLPAPFMIRPLLYAAPLTMVVCALPEIETRPLILWPGSVVMLLMPLPLIVI